MGANGQPYSADLWIQTPFALSTTWALLKTFSAQSNDAAIVGTIESVRLFITTIALGAANIVIRLTADAAGDQPLSADITTAIVTGITTGTSGSVRANLSSLVYVGSPITPSIYIWAKTDAGTCNVTAGAILGWGA